LTWALYYIATRPEIEAQLLEELQQVIGACVRARLGSFRTIIAS